MRDIRNIDVSAAKHISPRGSEGDKGYYNMSEAFN